MSYQFWVGFWWTLALQYETMQTWIHSLAVVVLKIAIAVPVEQDSGDPLPPLSAPPSDSWEVQQNLVPPPMGRKQQLSVQVGAWADRANVALWNAIPIEMPGCFVEFGGIVNRYQDQNGNLTWPNQGSHLALGGGGRCDTRLNRYWHAFGSLKLLANWGLNNTYPINWLDPGISIGTITRLRESIYLRMELGYPTGFSIGLTFPFGHL